MQYIKKTIYTFLTIAIFFGCKKDPSTVDSGPKLKFVFKFDAAQPRLDNLGNPSVIPVGNAAQTPDFKGMSAHFIEFVPTKFTQLGLGSIVYKGAEVAANPVGTFTTAINFDKAIISDEGLVFLEVPMSKLAPGTYEYLRVSVTYQNYDIKFNVKNIPSPSPISFLNNQTGRVASFLGYNAHINSALINMQSIAVNADKKQGFWAFEPNLSPPYNSFYNSISSGQAPDNATTVVNPLESFGVDIPRGSCIVTGALESPLTITGSETTDKTVTLSFSINKSFEWKDTNSNGQLDVDATALTAEQIVDMGLRGLVVKVE